MPAEACWRVYVLECAGGTLYTGISTDTARRFAEHASGKGARYTRANPPERVLADLQVGSRSLALRVECAIKRLDRRAKRRLCEEIAAGRLRIEDIASAGAR
jgi:putative endonuclease